MINDSILSISIFKESGATSQNTGLAPLYSIGKLVAVHVNNGLITSSSLPTPARE